MRRWKVFKAYGTWHGYEYGWNRYESFPTWREAMEYARRQAQLTPNTVTIEDPSGALCDLTARVTDQHYIRLKAGDDAFILAPHEWKPLAHFLLAADKHQENK